MSEKSQPDKRMWSGYRKCSLTLRVSRTTMTPVFFFSPHRAIAQSSWLSTSSPQSHRTSYAACKRGIHLWPRQAQTLQSGLRCSRRTQGSGRVKHELPQKSWKKNIFQLYLLCTMRRERQPSLSVDCQRSRWGHRCIRHARHACQRWASRSAKEVRDLAQPHNSTKQRFLKTVYRDRRETPSRWAEGRHHETPLTAKARHQEQKVRHRQTSSGTLAGHLSRRTVLSVYVF